MGTFDPHASWHSRWRKLWSGLCHQRTSFVLWCLFNHGFYTNQRGVLWGVDPKCPVCKVVDESTEHLFSECPRVLSCWNRFCTTTRGSIFDLDRCFNLKESICMAVSRQRHYPTFIILVAEIISSTWLKCNSVVFHGEHYIVPPLVIWRKAATQLEALLIRAENPQSRRIILANINSIHPFVRESS